MDSLDDLGFDPSKLYLGQLCKHGHDWNGSGQSLRRISNSDCAECNRQRGSSFYKEKRQPRLQAQARKRQTEKSAIQRLQHDLLVAAGVDTQRFRLGSLCRRQHHWNGTEFSLRYRQNDSSICVECSRERQKNLTSEQIERNATKQAEWRERNREALLERKRRYHHANKEAIAKKHKVYHQRNKTWLNAKARGRYQQSRDEHRAYRTAYYQSDRGKMVRAVAQQRRRARKKQVHSVPYSGVELQQHYEKFGRCCAYCLTPSELTVDHFIALVNGGANVLGNIVPACLRCNCSKQEADPLEWFSRQEFYSQTQWKKILKILGKTQDGYSQQIPLF